MKHGKYFMVCILVCSMLFCSCSKKEEKQEIVKETKKAVIEKAAESTESTGQEAVVDSGLEKGYGLPVAEQERDEAERDSCQLMALLADIYINADKGNSLNVVLDNKTMKQMMMKLQYI